jgi:predicted acetyltransferase
MPGLIELVLAGPEQESVLANLLELYAHDFSEFYGVELGADGRFGYPDLPLYWNEADRYPFLVKVDGRLAGFVFVKRSSKVWDIAEFFVARAYRRKGIGMKVAHDVWRRFPGPWEVRVMESNRTALKFWERSIAAFNDGEPIRPACIEQAGRRWHLFRFESRPAA